MNVTPEVIERLKRLASLLSKKDNTPRDDEKDKKDLNQNPNGNVGVNNAATGESLSGKIEKLALKPGYDLPGRVVGPTRSDPSLIAQAISLSVGRTSMVKKLPHIRSLWVGSSSFHESRPKMVVKMCLIRARYCRAVKSIQPTNQSV